MGILEFAIVLMVLGGLLYATGLELKGKREYNLYPIPLTLGRYMFLCGFGFAFGTILAKLFIQWIL